MESLNSLGRNEWLEELSFIYKWMRKCGMDRARKLPSPHRELFHLYNERDIKEGIPTGLPYIVEYKNHEVFNVGDVAACLDEIDKYGDYCFFDGEDDVEAPHELQICAYAEARHFRELHKEKGQRFLNEMVNIFIHDYKELFPRWTNKRNREVIALALVEMFTWTGDHESDMETARMYLDYLKSKKTVDKLLLKL